MTQITLYSRDGCHRTGQILNELNRHGVDYRYANVEINPEARDELIALTGSAEKFPTIVIAGRKIRNPSGKDLECELARAGLIDGALIHDEKSQRFIRRMRPKDAFVSYTLRNNKMILTHIEVDPSHRGKGIGARFAIEVFEALEDSDTDVRLTCSFLRRVAGTKEKWRNKFGIGGIKHG